jgi:hypothetical protein
MGGVDMVGGNGPDSKAVGCTQFCALSINRQLFKVFRVNVMLAGVKKAFITCIQL